MVTPKQGFCFLMVKIVGGPSSRRLPLITQSLTQPPTFPAAVRDKLAHQLRLTEEVVRKYPTVAHAEAAGYRRAGPFRPGSGVHYGRAEGLIEGDRLTDEAILNPVVLIYDGTAPTSQVAGLMYLFSRAADQANTREPEGFAGSADRWHYHSNYCLVTSKDGSHDIFPSKKEDCIRRGGSFTAVGGYGVHVWPVASYANPMGVFAHANPALSCPDGTYFTGRMRMNSICASGHD